ncbi:MAG: transcriptional repressor LexA [Planctomycetota bacterium]
MRLTLTERQLQVLRYFRDYRRERGISPTLEEAAAHLGVSKITVYEHLNQLVHKGAVERTKAKARSVAVLYDPDAESDMPEAQEASVPVLGTIAAGAPIEVIEDAESFTFRDLVPTPEGHYLLRVRGQSMIEDHIQDGDLVVVEHRNTARNGDIVVAIVDEEATLKRYFRESDGRVRLQPANQEMDPIYPGVLEIRGVVRGVVRQYR